MLWETDTNDNALNNLEMTGAATLPHNYQTFQQSHFVIRCQK